MPTTLKDLREKKRKSLLVEQSLTSQFATNIPLWVKNEAVLIHKSRGQSLGSTAIKLARRLGKTQVVGTPLW